jgi:hypothetical protein
MRTLIESPAAARPEGPKARKRTIPKRSGIENFTNDPSFPGFQDKVSEFSPGIAN